MWLGSLKVDHLSGSHFLPSHISKVIVSRLVAYIIAHGLGSQDYGIKLEATNFVQVMALTYPDDFGRDDELWLESWGPPPAELAPPKKKRRTAAKSKSKHGDAPKPNGTS